MTAARTTNIENLCLALVQAESEAAVVGILQAAGLWDAPEHWRNFGDKENNFGEIGNQQDKPDAAFVEKLINSVDAVLMGECMSRGIDPAGPDAPQSIKDATTEFFGIHDGRLSCMTAFQRTALAEKSIRVVATGAKSNPCYAIIDSGEGQTPQSMSETLLSLGKSNKLRIPFVQGKFNMGGTGVFQFCGRQNLQLILTRRHPSLVQSPADEQWGFTIVRREDPGAGVRSSTYRYLAPDGNVLAFNADSLPVLPGRAPAAYGELMEWGTYIKLYEYDMAGMKTNILMDLYNRLSLLMPDLALPIRLYERRGYNGHTLETTLSGLAVRLDEDTRENLEPGFPVGGLIQADGQDISFKVYAFTKNPETGKSRAEKYTRSEGVIFSINGQTHGTMPQEFFGRNTVKMGYLKKSLLVVCDCSKIEGRAREDLFMNSRDRLRSGPLQKRIVRELEIFIAGHPGLKQLRERRRSEDMAGRLADQAPMANVLERIMKNSPTLSRLFIQGTRLSAPYSLKKVAKADAFEGVDHPTFFTLTRAYPVESPKPCHLNKRLRVQFKTNAKNDYFDRDVDPGEWSIKVDGVAIDGNNSLNLWQGTATLNAELPSAVAVDDKLHYTIEIRDPYRAMPFECEFHVKALPAATSASGPGGPRRPPASDTPGDATRRQSGLALPEVVEVGRDEWDRFEFDKNSALKVEDAGNGSYDFYLNVDNVHLATERRSRHFDADVLKAQYSYGMVLIGLALLNDSGHGEVVDYERIAATTSALSPFLLPMIRGLGELEEE